MVSDAQLKHYVARLAPYLAWSSFIVHQQQQQSPHLATLHV